MPPYQKILVPFDFSFASEAALREAHGLAKTMNACLEVFHVIEPAEAMVPPVDHVMAPGLGRVPTTSVTREELTTHVTEAGVDDVELVIRLGHGSPWERILDHAATYETDLIVMGTRGSTGLARMVLGSVTEQVVRRAKVPVLTVHAHAPE